LADDLITDASDAAEFKAICFLLLQENISFFVVPFGRPHFLLVLL
jgi:hypothetical protein